MSGNHGYYDVLLYTLSRRYYNQRPRTYMNTELDTYISTYTPVNDKIISNPSCMYYLLSPQRYLTLNVNTTRDKIVLPTKYFRHHLYK